MSEERLNLIISTDQMNSIQICPTLYRYKSVEYKSPAVKAPYLEAGDFMHFLLKEYYTILMNSQTPDVKMIAEVGRNWAARNIIGLKSDAIEDVVSDFQMYCDHYGHDNGWVVEAVEEPFAKILYESDKLRIGCAGKADLRVLVQRTGRRVIVDHKYEGKFDKKADRDNQVLCYSWAYETSDFVFNRIGKQQSYKPADRLKREYFNILKHQIQQWVDSAIAASMDILRFHESDNWPMRMTGCNYRGARCSFYEVCNTTESNREYKLESMFVDRVKASIMEKK